MADECPHRKRVLAEHEHLTLAGLYNVLEKLRAGIARDKAQLNLGGGAMRATSPAAPAGPKPAFPPTDLRQTAAVMGTLARATAPLSSTAIAISFRQGRRVLPQIEAVLAALVWDGWVSQAEGNAGFVLRKAA